MNTDIQLSPHFHLREFLHNGSAEGLTVEILENLRKLVQKLELAREKLGNKPMHITSGFRTAAHNKAIGGALHSYHLKGMAADFVVEGMTPSQVRATLDAWWPYGMELGTPTWVHLDIRPNRARFRP